MTYTPPETFNLASYLLDARLVEGLDGRAALHTDRGTLTYREVWQLANRFGNVLRDAGVAPEQRVMIALPDEPAFVATLFGTLKIGAVVVMVNPDLKADALQALLAYTRASAVVTRGETAGVFRGLQAAAPALSALVALDDPEWKRRIDEAPTTLEPFPTHRDDAAIWLFSGGTTGVPKAVVQTHRSFANTTECYARGVIEYTAADVTLSVPKLYFGYATGSNLFFPFAVGGSAVLFPERCTAEVLFEKIARFRPTILINVPAMINQMVSHPGAARRDLSSLRVCTSAGEALPPELDRRWRETFGVELLDGLGTAEMWHIFLSNRPGRARPGTLGEVVPGFTVKVCDEEGRELADGEIGWLWVTGDSRAIAYWQRLDDTRRVFRGDWYVSGDLVRRDADGYFTYCGRADDLLKISGKWLAPQEVESCLLQHPAVREAAVVGVPDASGLVKPHAFVVAGGGGDALARELEAWVAERLEPYKRPRAVVFLDALPRTHLGKVDRGRLKKHLAVSPERR